jgi:hypothetical protein
MSQDFQLVSNTLQECSCCLNELSNLFTLEFREWAIELEPQSRTAWERNDTNYKNLWMMITLEGMTEPRDT